MLVSFSELESFFMVPLEAMSTGCPSITTNVSSIVESVGDAGIIIDKGDVQAAKKKVISLLDLKTRESYSVKAQEWAASFEAEKCSDMIVQKVTAEFTKSNRS